MNHESEDRREIVEWLREALAPLKAKLDEISKESNKQTRDFILEFGTAKQLNDFDNSIK